MDLEAALDSWLIPRPRTLRVAGSGTNNLSRFVDTPGGSYFFRVYQNTADSGRIRYEHTLLLRLRDAELPFAVPQPLATRQGNSYAMLGGDGDRAVAALFPVIVGRHPKRGYAAHASACGEALAVLDGALAEIEMDPELPPLPPYGDLGHIHPLVPDPLEMLRNLPIRGAQRGRIRALFDQILAQVPGLYERLPRQMIHADCGRSNMLLHEGRVSGLLDFEFAMPDLCAMDFAVALWSFGIAPWQTARGWAVIEALAAGYGRRGSLTSLEVAMLPTLLRLREATALVHWVGRMRQGLATAEDIAGRVGDVIGVDRWLRAHSGELIQRVEEAMIWGARQ